MSADMIPLISKALGETVYMVAVSMLIATLIGIPLGVLLHTTNKNQILECLVLNKALGAVVNAVRSILWVPRQCRLLLGCFCRQCPGKEAG